jgi:hypothetical protein
VQKCLFITLLRFLARYQGDGGERQSPLPLDPSPLGDHAVLPAPIINGVFTSKHAPRLPSWQDLAELLFGEEPDPAPQCKDLLDRTVGVFLGRELDRFCSLFRLRLRLYFGAQAGQGWKCIDIVPSKPTSAEAKTIKADVLAQLSLCMVKRNWRVLAPIKDRPADYLAALRRTYDKNSLTDFAKRFEKTVGTKRHTSDDDELPRKKKTFDPRDDEVPFEPSESSEDES